MRTKVIFFFLILFLLQTFNSCTTTELIFPLKSLSLSKEYQNRERKADRKYKKRMLIIEGRVSQLYKNEYGEHVLVLARRTDAYGIHCTMRKLKKLNSKPFKQNQLLKIKGICKGWNQNVILESCVIVK